MKSHTMIPNPTEEILIVVDENDTPVGTKRRKLIHGQRLRHRSAHVLVFNSADELLIQLRGPSKDEYPLFWDVSVGGHVGPGETYEQAAHRELDEELGLTGDLQFLRKTAATEQTGWEFTCLYRLTTDQPIRPNRHEIEECEFVTPGNPLAEIRSGRRRATPALSSVLAFYLSEEHTNSDSDP